MLFRKILAKIWENIDSPDIIILNGARQTGKTSLMQMIKDKLTQEKHIASEQIHWFDLEKVEDLELWSKQTAALSRLPLTDKKNHYLFIDEFQKSKTIGSTLKVIHDHYPQFKCLLTGSASWYLSIDESMAGRKTIIPVYPLNFSEYLAWQENPADSKRLHVYATDPNSVTATDIERLNARLLDFIAYGGYPRSALAKTNSEKSQALAELINSYLLRDIQLLNYAADTLQVQKLLTLLSGNAAGLLDVSTLSTNSGLGRSALVNRLGLLQNTFLAYFVPPYFSNKLKELIKNPKVYLLDTGLRNMTLKDFSVVPRTNQFGPVAENFVFTELQKQCGITDVIRYWRTKQGQEVDLLIRRGNVLLPIEIKSGDITDIPNGLKSFIKLYHPTEAFILNWSIIKDMTFDNCQVKFRPLWHAEQILTSVALSA